MNSLLDPFPISSEKTPRRTRTKRTPTQEELLATIADSKKALRAVRKRAREDAILRLGRLAFQAGLASWSDADLLTEFKRLAARGMLILLALSALLFPACTTTFRDLPRAPGETLEAHMWRTVHDKCVSNPFAAICHTRFVLTNCTEVEPKLTVCDMKSGQPE